MNDSAYKISLDINAQGSQVALNAKKSDTGRKIYISLRAGGTPYPIADDCYAVFAATKPDGSILYNACTIEGNEIVYEFTEQTCSAVGNNRCEIKLYGLDDKLITSPRFTLLVDGTVYPDEQVESTDEFSALTKLVSDTVAATNNANDASETATTAAQGANAAAGAARSASDEAHDAADQAYAAAGTAISTANAAASAAERTANAAASTANTAADNANKATTNANTATQNANTAAGAANAAAGAATKAAENANEASKAANDAAFKAAHTAKSLMVVGEENGPIISVDDAIEQYLVGLRVFGKTTQNGTPTPDAPVDLVSAGNGDTLMVNVCGKNLANYPARTGQESTVDNDGFIVATNSSTVKTYVHVPIIAPYGEITVSIENIGGSDVYIQRNGSDYDLNGRTSFSRTVTANGWLRVMWSISPGVTSKVRIMATRGTATLPYEPFKNQALTVHTPNGLPGIPVTSGGNYTDSNGQRWVCDEIDFWRGVYIQRCGHYVFNGSEDWEGVFTSTVNGTHYVRTPVARSKREYDDKILCNLGKGQLWVGPQYTLFINGYAIFAVGGDALRGAETIEEFKEIIAENPIELVYELETPIETDLTAEDLAAYAAMYTYKDHTTVSNDAGAWMDLEYVMDAKKYIDSLMTGTIIPATVE